MSGKQNVFERLYNTPTVASRMHRIDSKPPVEEEYQGRFHSPRKASDFARLYKSTKASQKKVTTPRSKGVFSTPRSKGVPSTPPTKSLTPTPKRTPENRPRRGPSTAHYAMATASSSAPSPIVASTPQRRSPGMKSSFQPTRTTTPRKEVATTPKKKPIATTPRNGKPSKSSSPTTDRKSQDPPSQPKKEPETTKTETAATPPPNVVATTPSPAPTALVVAPAPQPLSAPSTEESGKLFYDQGAKDDTLSMEQVEHAVDKLYPSLAHKSLALLAYQAQDGNMSGRMEAAQFPYFLHFLVYFNNLWEDFVFFDEDEDLRISKGEFMPVAQRLELFDDVEATFAAMDKSNQGFVLFDDFCALCAKRKLESENNKAAEAVGAAEKSSSTESEQVQVTTKKNGLNADVVKEILNVFDGMEMPTKQKALDIFGRLDQDGSGKLSMAEVCQGIVDIAPIHDKKLQAYKLQGSCKDGQLDAAEFYYFVLYLAYFNMMWEEFVFFDDDDLRVSKGEFLPVAESLHLFEDLEAEFAAVDQNDEGFILFEDFCSMCAKRQLEISESA